LHFSCNRCFFLLAFDPFAVGATSCTASTENESRRLSKRSQRGRRRSVDKTAMLCTKADSAVASKRRHITKVALAAHDALRGIGHAGREAIHGVKIVEREMPLLQAFVGSGAAQRR
jgi:hypothetical protein